MLLHRQSAVEGELEREGLSGRNCMAIVAALPLLWCVNCIELR